MGSVDTTAEPYNPGYRSGRLRFEVEDGTRTACLGDRRGDGAHAEHDAGRFERIHFLASRWVFLSLRYR